MSSVSPKWIDILETLPSRDFCTLVKAILRDEDKPVLSPKSQPVADEIYRQLERRDYLKMAKRKQRANVDINKTSTRRQQDVNIDVNKEERKEALPPCSPSFFPPHPLSNTPYNPPSQEKREETSPPSTSPPTPKKPDWAGKAATYAEIVGHLNEKAGTHYLPTSSATRQLIDARMREGFTIADFKTVIDRKTSEWCGTEFEKFLRPLTLFGGKFESYLNGKQGFRKPTPNASEITTDEEMETFLRAFNGDE